jgi:hypothetical protein
VRDAVICLSNDAVIVKVNSCSKPAGSMVRLEITRISFLVCHQIRKLFPCGCNDRKNQGRSVTLDWRFLLDESPIFLSTIWYIKIMTKL